MGKEKGAAFRALTSLGRCRCSGTGIASSLSLMNQEEARCNLYVLQENGHSECSQASLPSSLPPSLPPSLGTWEKHSSGSSGSSALQSLPKSGSGSGSSSGSGPPRTLWAFRGSRAGTERSLRVRCTGMETGTGALWEAIGSGCGVLSTMGQGSRRGVRALGQCPGITGEGWLD